MYKFLGFSTYLHLYKLLHIQKLEGKFKLLLKNEYFHYLRKEKYQLTFFAH